MLAPWCRAPFPHGDHDLPALALTLRLLDRKELLVGALRDMCAEAESMRATGVFGYHPRPKKNEPVRRTYAVCVCFEANHVSLGMFSWVCQ